MHATIRTALAPAALAALLAAPASAQAPAPLSVEFQDDSLSARQKEQLTKYAETVRRWAMVQRVVQAVAEQNGREVSPERIQEIDAAWQKGGNPGGLPGELERNSCAQALQALLASNPGYAELFVADARGALVCMNARTSDYYQGDEDNFVRAFAGGAGATFVSSQAADESVGLELVHISVPVMSGGRAIGVLTAGRLAIDM